MSSTVNLAVTDAARASFRAALDADGSSDCAVRVAVEQNTAQRFDHVLDLVPPEGKRPDDLELMVGDVRLWVDPTSARLLDGATIDYVVDRVQGEGFKIDNPNRPAQKQWSDPIAQKLQELLDGEINPSIASHGGYITLLDYRDNRAFVHMGGGCQGCGMAAQTLKQGVETRVRQVIPEIEAIIDSTDHAAGQNPYYQSEG